MILMLHSSPGVFITAQALHRQRKPQMCLCGNRSCASCCHWMRRTMTKSMSLAQLALSLFAQDQNTLLLTICAPRFGNNKNM